MVWHLFTRIVARLYIYMGGLCRMGLRFLIYSCAMGFRPTLDCGFMRTHASYGLHV